MNGMKAPWYSVFSFLSIYLFSCCCLEATKKKKHLDENDFRVGYGNYFKSVILQIPWYQHWQWHLKDTLQLKILQTWINIYINSFLDKYHEQRWAKMPWKLLVPQKFEPILWRVCARHFTYYYLLSLWKKPSF